MCQSQPATRCEGEKVNGSNLSGGVENGASATPTEAEVGDAKDSSKEESRRPAPLTTALSSLSKSSTISQMRRRRKRDRQTAWLKELSSISNNTTTTTSHKRIVKKKKKSRMASKHGDDSKSGGLDALIPSAIGVVVFIFVVMAMMGFRGRATVAGIDLGTTNSVVCVQSPSKGVGEIVCIPDPATNSPVVPSVVSFMDNHHLRSFRLTKEEKERTWPDLVPHPVDALVGQAAKDRINSHPHHTMYHAKRIIGREHGHDSVNSLQGEVDFDIVSKQDGAAAFGFPYHLPPSSPKEVVASSPTTAILTPYEIGAYVIHHLRTLTRNHLKHDNVQSAVIAIPAKFEPAQRDATIRAFELAGLRVARVLEEPTAAALAYGLHKRDDVHYVMVYDFGGGTLDISLLYIGEGGYIDVLGSDGDEQLGGADFDAAVAHWLLERKGGEEIVKVVMASVARIEEDMVDSNLEVTDVEDLIEELCPKLKRVPLCTISSFHTIGERMKIRLSDHAGEPEAVADETCYRLPSKNIESVPNTAEELCEAIFQVNLSMTLEEYDVAVDHLYKRSLLPIERLLKDLDLHKEEVDEVVMVGGTTRMPQIRELVRKQMEKERLNTNIDPDLTVAYGAASVID
eukprot:CAMPEP_0172552598 /NCGR_PEP_ID=MMETSP1067-20121228/46275_1 /TAXON_ID=265564 ORGANISM="Thalassiosira punctigera, Strain Tpunct2005C2" /NCGR_SAMPLE_ID=MMETSP1067 /ASSEMBLY_ACC=CAM_ASM_000444 /LENGTH=625 /DNA_ID=CAMNT_0013340619 /DNA_START=62 /DNA_END=1939 /DNA_ORIENTATION=+